MCEYVFCNNVILLDCGLAYTNTVRASVWALAHCDDISHYFLNFYEPNNQWFDGENNQQIHPG